MEDLIFNIQRYCLHDGPGIRTVLFLKGCHLQCRWCSNPESQRFTQELIYKEATCIKCGTCVVKCPQQVFEIGEGKLDIKRQRCNFCGICTTNCCTKSLEISGENPDFDKIMEIILQDKSYYDMSGGGVTLSGGEALAHRVFCRKILTALKTENIHTAVETSGYTNTQTLVEMMPLIDLFLFDLKHISPEAHLRGTGKDNQLILDNLTIAVSSGANIIIRYTLIPGFNSQPEALSGIADLMTRLNLNEIDILPYHRLGSEKYKNLGRNYDLAALLPPERETMQEAKDYFIKRGIKSVTLY